MYALKWDRPGASPVLRWALSLPLGFDPSFAQVWLVLSTWWRLAGLFDFVRQAWSALSELPSPKTGIFHAVSCALELLGWTLGADWVLFTPWFHTPWHRLSLDELRKIVGHFWQQRMVERLHHRKDFAGLNGLDCQISFGSYRAHDLATAELVATIQDGTFYTNNIFAKFDPDKPALCVQCNQTDDLQHRCLYCPRFADVRDRHQNAVTRWPSQTRAFTDHALVGLNPFLGKHWRFLMGMPSQCENFYLQPSGDGVQHVFTDGTCLAPKTGSLRLAAWAVVSMRDNLVLADGLLPGLIQTIDAAELYATYACLRWSLWYGVEVCIHSDSSYAVNGLNFLKNSHYIPRHWKNQELWAAVNEVLRQLDPGQWCVHKVFAHGDPAYAPSALDEWWLAGNRKADRAAARVFERSPASFWNNYLELCKFHDQQSQMVSEQIAFLLDMARSSLEQKPTHSVDVEDLPLSALVLSWSPNQCDLASQFLLESIADIDVQNLDGFSAQFSEPIASFIYSVDLEAPQARFVSGLELLCAFLSLHEGAIPHPKLVGGVVQYLDPDVTCAGGLMRHTIASGLRIFRLGVEKVLTSLGVQFQVKSTSRPDLYVYVKHWSIFIGWPMEVAHPTDSLLASWFAPRPYRRACDLARPIP